MKDFYTLSVSRTSGAPARHALEGSANVDKKSRFFYTGWIKRVEAAANF